MQQRNAPGSPIKAVATTDALGNATIIVPPLASGAASAYLVIARTDKFDYIKTASSLDTLYSEYTVQSINALQTKNASLAQLATFNGKILPAKQTEFFGSYLNIIQPEYMDWNDDQEQYPFVMVAQGAWDLTTGVTPPEGFVPDQPAIAASVADATSAVQFTFTDVGSAWTQTTVDQSIVHLGQTTNVQTQIPMRNRKPTKARNDNVTMMLDDGSVSIAVLANDRVGVKAQTISLTSFTQPSNGVVTLAADNRTLIYTATALRPHDRAERQWCGQDDRDVHGGYRLAEQAAPVHDRLERDERGVQGRRNAHGLARQQPVGHQRHGSDDSGLECRRRCGERGLDAAAALCDVGHLLDGVRRRHLGGLAEADLDAAVVNGTSATISYRVGDTATPDASWTPLTALAGSGGVLSGSGRYIQFTVQLSTTDASKAPTLKDVTINYRLP